MTLTAEHLNSQIVNFLLTSTFWIGHQGEDLDFAYGSISAFASRRTNQEAILGAEESIKEIK